MLATNHYKRLTPELGIQGSGLLGKEGSKWGSGAIHKRKWGLRMRLTICSLSLVTWLENIASLCRHMTKMVNFQLQLGLSHWSALFTWSGRDRCLSYCSHDLSLHTFITLPIQTPPCLTTNRWPCLIRKRKAKALVLKASKIFLILSYL